MAVFTGGHHARTSSAMSGVMVERACLALQSTQEKQVRDQAEQFLVSFRSSSNPYPIAKHVLDKSVDSSAQFHAVTAYREGLLREWGILEPRQIEGLRTELLAFATNRGSSLAPFVMNQLQQCICVIFKRDFLRNPQLLTSTLLTQLSQLLASSQPSQRLLAVSLCAALINEFSSSHSSSIGVNIQFHDNCHQQFEKLCLPSLTSLLLSTLQPLVASKVDKALLTSLCKALQAALNWDFTEDKPHSWMKEEVAKYCPPQDSNWQSIFLQGPLLEMLAVLERQSEEIRDCITQCCCLQGAVLDTLPLPNKLQYFSRLITRCIEPLLAQPPSPDEPGEKKDVSLMLKRLFTNPSFGITSLLALPEGTAFVLRVVEHAYGIIRAGPEMGEAVGLTLEAWCDLLRLAKTNGPVAVEKLQLPQLCLVIFKQFVEHALLAPSLVMQRDSEEKEVWTQQVDSIGKIGRVNAQTSLALIRDLIAQRASLLATAKQLSAPQLAKIQGELAVLLSILQSSLGEKREVTEKLFCPPELLQLMAANPNANVILEVINMMKQLGFLILFNCPEASKGAAGSHLLQAFLGVLSCLAFAYLSGTDKVAMFSEGSPRHAELFQFLVACLASCLECTHERVREMCVELVEGMVEAGGATCLSTVATSAWWHIVQRWEVVQLSNDCLRRLITTICVGCAEGNAKAKGATSYRDGLSQFLVRPMSTELAKALSSPTPAAELSRTLSVARGIACASANRNAYPLLNEFTSSFLPAVVAALSRQSSPQVVLLLLQLIQATAECSVAFLKEAEMWKFCELILQAIDSWVNFNSRRAASAEMEGEQAGEIEALLVCIAGVVCKEAIDKSGDKFTRPTFPSEFALLALNRILPSFTTSLLLFPVVISNYFEILEVIIQVHPELFAAMDGSSRVTMIESAKFAIQSDSEEIVIASGLGIARSIGRFHYEAMMNSSRTPFTEDVQSLSRSLVKFMSENQSASLLEPLADALLPLLLLDGPGLMQLTLTTLGEPQLQPAFVALGEGLSRELSTANETRFRDNLLPFLLLARSLKTK